MYYTVLYSTNTADIAETHHTVRTVKYFTVQYSTVHTVFYNKAIIDTKNRHEEFTLQASTDDLID